MKEEVQNSFTKEVKNELANKKWKNKALSSILFGYLSLSKQTKDVLLLSSENISVIKLLLKILKSIYELNVSFINERRNRFTKAPIYDIKLHDEDLEKIPFYSMFLEGRYEEILSTLELQSVINGMFLKNGTINNPENGSYYLGIKVSDLEFPNFLLSKLEELPNERKIAFKIVKRKTGYILYIKRSEQIGNFLAFIGANVAMLNYENYRITRDVWNAQNRMNNCDTVNYNKAINTGMKNIADITIVSLNFQLTMFGKKAVKLMQIRFEHPDASYSELSLLAEDEHIIISRSSIAKLFSDIGKLAARCPIKKSDNPDYVVKFPTDEMF